jgi:hypothetical protein
MSLCNLLVAELYSLYMMLNDMTTEDIPGRPDRCVGWTEALLPTRPGICARSTGHSCPLDRAFLPARPGICARSVGHLRPLGRAFAPAGPDICARSAAHLRPLGRMVAQSTRRPRRRATAAASVRPEAPSLAKMLEMCTLTVLALMYS